MLFLYFPVYNKVKFILNGVGKYDFSMKLKMFFYVEMRESGGKHRDRAPREWGLYLFPMKNERIPKYI